MEPLTKLKNNKLSIIRSESASLHIGKNGLSPNFIEELNSRLKQNNIIKIKFLKNSPFETRENAFTELQKILNNDIKILETRGWTAVLQKR